ncbi:DNA polymerase III subunit delta [uncultured Ezakiella sp.]|uniref:DNA polymerase III subunit delta n=1 Tax=uncultured Ezakiella sp. TaxID=1637529 RepID=UPI0025EF0AC6|nr:DNA polymerase III subunit delta [uncultured Ezakiella sp.]
MEYTIFINRVKKKMIGGPYAFVGEETFLADNTLDLIKETYVDPSLVSMNYLLIDASKQSINDILESAYQLPLMSEKRLTVVKDISDAQIKELAGKIEELINLGSSSIVIFVFTPNNIKKTTNFYKFLSKADALVEFNTVSESQLNNWVRRKIEQNNVEIEDDALSLFLMHINYTKENQNNSLYFVDSELNKLFSTQKQKISIADIEELTSKSPSSNIFKLTDAISERNEKEALRQIDNLFKTNEEPVRILYMITRQIINMNKVYRELGSSQYEATKRIGISPFEYKKIRANINEYSEDELKLGLHLAKRADLIIKSKKNDSRILLESLLIGFIRVVNIYEV